MEQDTSFIGELIGKTVWVMTAGALGTKDASVGNYKGVLIGFDGLFIKLEYEIRKFTEGNAVLSKGVLLINTKYIMTLEEYKASLNI